MAALWSSIAWSIEWRWVAGLAAIVLLDAVRAVPLGSQLASRFLFSPWRPGAEPAAARGVRLLSWCPPLTMAVVVPEAAQTSRALPDRDALARWCLALRIGAGMSLLLLVVGVPLAVGSFGTFGFGASVALVLVFDVFVMVLAAVALVRLGAPRGRAWRGAAPIIGPFTTPRAAEIVVERVLEGATPVAAMRYLLSADSFAAWVRPRAYDALHRGVIDAAVAALGREELEAVVAAPPRDAVTGERYCPRCSVVYQERAESCSACEVPLALSPPR